MTQQALISTREAAGILGYKHVSNVLKMVKSGTLTPAMQLPGDTGAYLFDRAHVEDKARELAEARTS